MFLGLLNPQSSALLGLLLRLFFIFIFLVLGYPEELIVSGGSPLFLCRFLELRTMRYFVGYSVAWRIAVGRIPVAFAPFEVMLSLAMFD